MKTKELFSDLIEEIKTQASMFACNKNDMATREMTKEEAKILLSDKKIACFSMEETIAVQEMLLGLGFIWIDSTREVYGDAFLIFTRKDGCMCTTDNIKIWVGEKRQR